jgi:uncharacterized damage-inducible protein DinB
MITLPVSDRLNTQHLALAEIILGLSEEQLTSHPVPGKWSIRENIAHLARYQVVFIERLKKMLSEEGPAFEAYQAEKDPEFERWLSKNSSELEEEIVADRKSINALLTSLSAEQLKKTGVHSKFGRLTILVWTEFFLLHEAHHLFTIFRLAHSIQ